MRIKRKQLIQDKYKLKLKSYYIQRSLKSKLKSGHTKDLVPKSKKKSFSEETVKMLPYTDGDADGGAGGDAK